MRDMAGKPKSRSVAKPRKAQAKAQPKPQAKSRAKAQRISAAKPRAPKPRTRAKREPEPEPFMVTYDVVILSPDGTYDIDSMDVLNVPNFTSRDVVKCYREDHAEELDPKALLAVLVPE
jgi:hypothetical protein